MDADRIVAQAQEPARVAYYSPALRVFVEGWEQLRLVPYADEGGKRTIGFGHVMQQSDPDTPITVDEAAALLDTDLLYAADRVASLTTDPATGTSYHPLTQQQFDCLVDFAFNAGCGAFAGSTIRKRIIGGYLDEVPDLLLQWNKVYDAPSNGYVVSAGLAKRRAAERAIWTFGDYSRRP